MAARARRQFLADLGRDVQPASQGSPQADQGRLRSLGQTRCRPQGPRLPHGQRGGGTHRETSPREKGDRGSQDKIARSACPNLSCEPRSPLDRKSTRLNSSHTVRSYAVLFVKKKIIL